MLNQKNIFNKEIIIPFLKELALFLGTMIFILGILLSPTVFDLFFRGPIWIKLPKEYKGWVVIQYEDSSCPPLEKKGGYVFIPISSKGFGCVSYPILPGFRKWKYDYETADGKHLDLPHGYAGDHINIAVRMGAGPAKGDHISFPRLAFFVGSNEDLSSSKVFRFPVWVYSGNIVFDDDYIAKIRKGK
jgi:hypothetical protein